MQICDMRRKGTFGKMTSPTIMNDLCYKNNEIKSIVKDKHQNNIEVHLILHCINSLVGEI
jgi:hypothetical protein